MPRTRSEGIANLLFFSICLYIFFSSIEIISWDDSSRLLYDVSEWWTYCGLAGGWFGSVSTSFSATMTSCHVMSRHSLPLRDLQYLHTLGHIILFLYVTFSICIHWVTSFFSFYVTSSICMHWVTWFFSFTWPPVFACIGSHHSFPLRDLQYLHTLGHVTHFLSVTFSSAMTLGLICLFFCTSFSSGMTLR